MMAEHYPYIPQLYWASVIFGLLVLLSMIARSLYQAYFSPLAKFPGPKLAAFTFWYEFYHDVVLGGQYVFKIKELHEQYGNVISAYLAT
jgi:hypothetical protein